MRGGVNWGGGLRGGKWALESVGGDIIEGAGVLRSESRERLKLWRLNSS